ncbi:hypothetical protein KP509_05G069100 [Ceratopteris richardii]|nr:hypothetical protein KP509_05G069100 [Ceratopteris richardii]
MQGTLKLNDLEPAVELRDHLHSNELYSPKNQASSIYRLDPHCEDDLGTSRSLDSLCGRCSASSSCLTNSSYTKSDEHNSTSAENSSYMLSNEWQVEADPRSLIYEHSSDVDKWQGDVTEEIDSQLPEYERYPRYSVTGLCITDRDGIALIEDDTDGHRSKRDAYVKKGRRQRGSSFSAALPDALQHVVGDSVALVKISESPYEDFRQSIYEMIMDNDVEGLINVEDLLHCYLALNPPELHVLIRDAFTDVWSSILMNEMTI